MLQRLFHDFAPQHNYDYACVTKSLQLRVSLRFTAPRYEAYCKIWVYRFVTKDIQPAHNTFNTLRRRLGVKGFVKIHKRFVSKAYRLGLLDPKINDLPKNRKKGIILVADSTFLITAGSTRGQRDEHGRWHFNDESVVFAGKGRHSHKYPVGHKAHSLITISGILLVTLLTPDNESDQTFIFPLVEELVARYRNLTFSYIILDKGYDTEEIHHDIYEFFGIIPVIIRKKIVYPKGITEDGYPLCPWGFVMKPRGIEYKQRRTKYARLHQYRKDQPCAES